MAAAHWTAPSMGLQIDVPKDALTAFCEERGIKRLAIFGSALRPDFGSHSDLDVLVEFDEERTPGLLGKARIERELSELIDHHPVDLRTPKDLSRYFRDRVISQAEVQYERPSLDPPETHVGRGERATLTVGNQT